MPPDDRDFWSEDEWGDYDEGNNPPPDDWFDNEGEPSIAEILRTFDMNNALEFVVNQHDIEDGSQIRADRFSSLTDAIYFLWNIGVASFSRVVEIDVNVYAVAIPDHTP